MTVDLHRRSRHCEGRGRGSARLVLALGLILVLLASSGALAATVTFREGASGYTGCQDTFLQQDPASAGTNNGASAAVGWDGDDPSGTGYDMYTLLRFDGIFGNGAGQIPLGATITSATLTYTVFDPGDTATVHRVLASWTESSTYSTFCAGGCSEGTQYGPAAGNATAAANGTVQASVTATVQAWSDGAQNLGWYFLPTGPGGVDLRSSEHATLTERPLLTVVYNEGGPSSNLVRKPYLQLPTPTSMTIVWTTDVATDSRVRYGTTAGTLNLSATVPAASTSHIVPISDLTPATRYYYDVGSTTTVQGGGTAEHYFDTPPLVGTVTPFNVWVLGDSGTGDANQSAVRDAMLTFTASDRPEFMVHVGDIAYTGGTEAEFTDKHFAVYEDITRHMPHWPTLGNHEGQSTTSGAPGPSSGPYYEAFVLPTNAEAGGAPSGTEAYYSFDYANVHFVVLNSYQVSRSATGAMADWLRDDLAATTQQWIVAYWHHPPYSRGTHNSDTEIELVQMRENLLPILEAGGVDLVLSGHSHTYERSYLINGTYTTPTPSFAALEGAGHIVDDGDGRPTGDGAYHKSAGQVANEGAVYVVAGHGGAATGGSLGHPVMYFAETNHGSGLLEVNGNTLTFRNLRATGTVSDSFAIEKGPQSPRVQGTQPPKESVRTSLPAVAVTFTVPVTGVDAGDLTVGGSPATAVSCPSCSGGAGAGPYTFTGYAAPGSGNAPVVLAAGGIADASNPTLLFGGDTWNYTIDPNPPSVTGTTPPRGAEVGLLDSVSVFFTKGVSNVSPDDMTVNGSQATQVAGVAGTEGPYTFTGYAPPAPGAVSVVLAADGIVDDQGQPFAGDSWSYSLRRRLVINEFLASNNTAAQDENSEFDDYVEIYNPGSTAVDMSGMYLTDSSGFPNQYRIPDGVSIPAGGYLVFWCDGQPAQGPLHTNFSLSRTGEELGLYGTDADGFPAIDVLAYATQTTDVAFGRFPDAGASFVSMPVTPGAANTITCGTSGDCAALGDACNSGVCSASRCVRQPANEGLACEDGIACLSGSTCAAGACGGGASTCTGGEVCDVVSGLCSAPPPAPVLPIGAGATWRYSKGTVAAPALWATTAFDDDGWLEGPSGFGYGPDCTAQRGTTLSDMSGSYLSLLMRREFSVTSPGLVTSLTLTVDYDDAVVAYLNGTEVWRSASMGGTPGVPPAHDQASATADHECSAPTGTTSGPNPAEVIDLTSSIGLLLPGINVLALQGHNGGLTSSDFTVLATLTSTELTGCATNADCNDGNACTDDVCSGETCSNTVDDTNACSDGVACTSDACSAGACVSTSTCLPGLTCNTSTGTCDAAAVTVTFQQGVASYAGTQDTYLSEAAPGTANGASTSWRWDQDNPAGSNNDEVGLIRFDGIFGGGAGQIPPGSTIQSATLTLNVTNGSVVPAGEVRPAVVDWSAGTATWANFGGDAGAQADEYGATVASAPLATGLQPIVVTSTVQGWSASPASNFGWVFLPGATDGVQVDAAETATAGDRPKLSVTYVAPAAGCATDPECSDNNACNGVETCSAGSCLPGTALVCNDGNPCTADSCDPGTGCNAPPVANGTACADGDVCNGAETCQAGTCTAGSTLSCDDGLACTADSCSAPSGCAHVSTCAPGQACNGLSGLCEALVAPPLPIQQGDTWRYFKGTVEPPSTWSSVAFDDASWLEGPSGFGYGPDCAAQRGTTLGDMQNGYVSLYTRRAFGISNPAGVTSLTLTVDYDDAFVAYLNGVEVARTANLSGNPPAFNQVASADHECSSSPTPNPAQTFDLTGSIGLLQAGGNVLAIQGHNLTSGSSDFTLTASLTATEVSGPQGRISCVLDAPEAPASSSVGMDVRLANLGALAPLSGYQAQVAITRTSGAGTVAVSCPTGVAVNEGLADYLFAGRNDTLPATNCPLLRASSSVAGGAVTAPADAYLAGYVLDVLPDATPGSTFEVAVLAYPDSALVDANLDPVAFERGPACVLTIAASSGCVTAGQCDDGDPCTADSCVAGTCTYAPGGACGVSGAVRYYRASGSEPSVKGVPNVAIDVDENAALDATTDGAGTFAIPAAAGRVVTRTLPKFGAPRASDHNGAISSLDASLAAQHAVGSVVLSANQQLAADVTGNGSISSLDASRIAQFAVEQIQHFDVAVASGSDWHFLRCDNYTGAASQDCGPPEHVHDPIAGPETDDFYAVLYGDVTGNWSPASTFAPSFGPEAEAATADRVLAASLAASPPPRAERAPGSGAATLTLAGGPYRLAPGQRQTIAIAISGADGIEALDLVVRYDARRLSIVDVQQGNLARGFQLVQRAESGVLKAGLFGVTPFAGAGELLLITVEARSDVVVRLPFEVEAQANEGAIPVRVGPGRGAEVDLPVKEERPPRQP